MLRLFPAVLFLTVICAVLLFLSSFEGTNASHSLVLEEAPTADDAPEFDKGTLTIQRANHTPITFSAEIAHTPTQRKYGLMFRQDMPAMHGMLFIFDTPQLVNMWMMNTPLALDMLFINTNNTIIKIAENTTPYSLQLISSEKEVDKVLELKAGEVRKWGIAVGDRVAYGKE